MLIHLYGCSYGLAGFIGPPESARSQAVLAVDAPPAAGGLYRPRVAGARARRSMRAHAQIRARSSNELHVLNSIPPDFRYDPVSY